MGVSDSLPAAILVERGDIYKEVGKVDPSDLIL
jgi:hypothetical protein